MLKRAIKENGRWRTRHAYLGAGHCCGEPEYHEIHFTETECALLMLELGFKVVDKRGRRATKKQLEAAIKKGK